MGQNREFRIDKYIANWLSTKMQRQFSRERPIFSINGAAAIGYPYAKRSKNHSKPNITYKNSLKVDHRPNTKSRKKYRILK